VQDKANVVSEKATIDRQLKALQAQTGKLTKVLNSFTEHMSSPSAMHMDCCLHRILIWQLTIPAIKQADVTTCCQPLPLT